MYVCVCNAISDRQVTQALAEGMQTVGEIRRHLGVRSCCGRCTAHMRSMVQAHNGQAAADCSYACCLDGLEAAAAI